MIKLLPLVFALSAGLAGTATAAPATTRALSGAVWVVACEAALAQRIKRERAPVANLATRAETLEDWQISLTETGVRGNGIATAPRGDAPFTFDCVYGERLRAVTRLRYRMGML